MYSLVKEDASARNITSNGHVCRKLELYENRLNSVWELEKINVVT